MATNTRSVAGVQMIALSEIRHNQNVRQEILAEEVDALAQSIALLGQLTPVSVRPDNENGGYVLICRPQALRGACAARPHRDPRGGSPRRRERGCGEGC
jgi:hypothetical protein